MGYLKIIKLIIFRSMLWYVRWGSGKEIMYMEDIKLNGEWGLGIGPNPQSPIPNPQSPSSKSIITIYIY